MEGTINSMTHSKTASIKKTLKKIKNKFASKKNYIKSVWRIMKISRNVSKKTVTKIVQF